MRRVILEAGQRYVRQFHEDSAQHQIWEVKSVYPDPKQIQHARLVNIGNQSETKTLSCFALNGRHGFRLVST